MRQAEDITAVLVIRAWHESGAEPSEIRARLTQTPDTNVAGWEQTAAAGEDEILDAVRSWLHALEPER